MALDINKILGMKNRIDLSSGSSVVFSDNGPIWLIDMYLDLRSIKLDEAVSLINHDLNIIRIS